MNLSIRMLISYFLISLLGCMQQGTNCTQLKHHASSSHPDAMGDVSVRLGGDIEGESSINDDNDARVTNAGVAERTLVRKRGSSISARDPLWKLIAFSTSLQRPSLQATTATAVLDLKVLKAQAKSRDRPFHLTTLPSHLNLQMRLQKLDYFFTSLGINDEDCRLRLLCQLAQDTVKFSPLSSIFLDETRYNGDLETLTAYLLTSNAGAQLLAYIEAVQKGENSSDCSVWEYRCPTPAESMINYQALLVWREISKWLTVQVLANNKYTKFN